MCTPGRLLEHLSGNSGFRHLCAGIKMLVVDESDRMLDMGFHHDVAGILVAIAKTQVDARKRLESAKAECDKHLSTLHKLSGTLVPMPLDKPHFKLSKRAKFIGDGDPVRDFDHQTLLFSATVSTKVLYIEQAHCAVPFSQLMFSCKGSGNRQLHFAPRVRLHRCQ